MTTSNYTYDLNGNVLSGAGRTFTWNLDNRMDVVNASTGSAVMSYDYTGIRVKKSGSTGTTYFPFSDYEVQGDQVTKYIKLGNETIASKKGTNRFFYHNDHLGGVNIVSDTNTAQVQLNEYDPWGKVARSVGSTEPTHRFTGQELDPESGIHYYGGRYYDQSLGRFISADPFIQDPSDPQNLNRYSYVLNSPQNYVDPSGYEGFSFDYLFGGFSDFFSSFFQPSYQSQVQTAQSNNQFLSNTLYAGDCGWCGATNSYQIAMTKYAAPQVEWDGMISGRGGNYSIFDGTKYEAGLGSVWFGNLDDFIPAKSVLKGASLAGGGIIAGVGKIGGEATENAMLEKLS